ncbi:MAG: N-acetylmuramoyl-L-alanine amidase [Bacteroidota bacterium]
MNLSKFFSFLLSVLFLLTGSTFVHGQQTLKKPIRTLIIDPGHGGKDPGAVGKKKYEKDVALKVALLLKDSVKKYYPNMKVVLTRDSDKFIPLHKRGEIAQNNNGDFFISIHCNGNKNRSKLGAETYVLGINEGQEGYETIIKENESMLFEDNHEEMYGGFDPKSPEGAIFLKLLKNVYRKQSLNLAERIQTNFRENLNRVDRGVKQAPFVVLYMCGMPAVLTEIGFISNANEENYLISEGNQKKIASNLCKAIVDFNEAYGKPMQTTRN